MILLLNCYFSDLEKVAAGIGHKLVFIFQATTTLVTGIIVGFVYLWQLTLLIIGCAPIFIIVSGFVQYVSIKS